MNGYEMDQTFEKLLVSLDTELKSSHERLTNLENETKNLRQSLDNTLERESDLQERIRTLEKQIKWAS